MLLAPIARADDDHGRGDRGRGHGDEDERARVVVQVQTPAQTVVVQRRDEDEDENEDAEERVVAPNAAAGLIAAINNEVANLTNREVENEDEDEDENEVEDVEVGQLAVISLGTLETGLSSADAMAVTNAVNANSAALQNFLNSGTPLANAIKTALTNAGINPASVLAILQGREDRLVIVTA
jgi:hypothetical protein